MGGGTIVERSWKNKYVHSKMACPPPTYDVISHNHSNWTSLNLPQNVREGRTNSYWKRQVLMFYPQGKNSGKPYGGIHPPPPLYVWALSHNFILILIRKLSLRVSFFPVSLLAKSATIAPKIKRQTSYPSHMGVFHPFPPLPPPPHPPNNHSWGDWVRLPLPGEGILPIMVYMGRPCLKGV